MQVFTGPFHPQLEAALVKEIIEIKATNSFAPLLILVPSDAMLRRLKRLLALEQKLSLIQLSMLTFHGLSMRLSGESEEGEGRALQTDLFFEALVSQKIKQAELSLRTFSDISETKGGCAALWQSLRDLKDGLVDPDLALQALQEGHFGRGSTKGLQALFQLYRQMRILCERAGIRGYGDLAQIATQQAPSSTFLSSFQGIFYYGFYDLTQVQIDLFHAVSRHYPSTLFFPLAKGRAAWTFAEQFFERFVTGASGEVSKRVDLSGDLPPEKNGLAATLFSEEIFDAAGSDLSATLISCFDLEDEVLTIAKEIVRIVGDAGIGFHEIGIVVREMEGYGAAIKSIFRKHAIPIARSAPEPMAHFPLTQTIFLLTTLLSEDFPRAACLDCFSSPYFNSRDLVSGGGTLSPDLWAVLCSRFDITKGLKSWQRLKGNAGKVRSGEVLIPPEEAALLLKVFMEMYEDLKRLPSRAAWSDYSARWKGLLEKYLLPFSPELLEELNAEEAAIRKAVLEVLDQLVPLDRIFASTGIADFIEAFQRGLSRASILIDDQEIAGVQVMDAASARGYAFKALFLLGMNEGIFPRKISEDPFLPDTLRRKIETTLGSKVGEKLSGHEEEKLLFTLLVGGAKTSLFLSFHRLDASGKPVAPSWYLSEFRRVLGKKSLVERTIPRTFQERQQVLPFERPDLRLLSESAFGLSLSSQNPGPLLEAFSFPPALYRAGRKALQKIVFSPGLTAYDGLIGAPKTYWEKLLSRGIAPSLLEKYATCPLQFYAKELLALHPTELPEDKTTTPRSDVGRLCHDILKAFYEALIQVDHFGRFEGKSSNSEITKKKEATSILRKVSEAVFLNYRKTERIPYLIAWESLQAQVFDLLSEVIVLDLAELAASGYRPVLFEKKGESKLYSEWTLMQGRIDRIDLHPESGLCRVIDYKYTLRREPTSEDKNLSLAAIRGIKLQTPIYQRLAEQMLSSKTSDRGAARAGSFFYYLAPNWEKDPLIRVEFPKNGWEGPAGEMLKETLSTLLSGIESGHFFMHPGTHCGYCEVALLCRKNHLPSRRRLQQNLLFEGHAALRLKALPKKAKVKK